MSKITFLVFSLGVPIENNRSSVCEIRTIIFRVGRAEAGVALFIKHGEQPRFGCSNGRDSGERRSDHRTRYESFTTSLPNAMQNYCFLGKVVGHFDHSLLWRVFFCQNFTNSLVRKAKLVAQSEINLHERHCSGQLIELLPNKPVTLDSVLFHCLSLSK